MMNTRTYTPTAAEAEASRQWFIIDAEGQTLGRLATVVARILRGKEKPTFSPHMDTGDFVIVVNADKVTVTGKKPTDKIYYSHSEWMGSLKAVPFKEMMVKHPTFAVEAAVRGMLPRNRLGAQMIKKLKVYAGANHPHGAQRPTALRIGDNGAAELAGE
jgi:large subunit ribosomal protein L13